MGFRYSFYEADGLAEVDALGEALGVELGDADPELLGLADNEPDGDGELLDDEDGLELLDDEGDALGLADGERLALGLELVSGSSALGRIFRVTSSI